MVVQLIKLNVVLEHKGRRVIVVGALDTGAEGFAFLDSSVATQLGLPIESRMSFTGVGGATQTGFKSTLDRMVLQDNPACELKKFPVLVGRLGLPGVLGAGKVRMLVGEDFLRSVGAELELTPEAVKIACRKGEKFPVREPFPLEFILIFGLPFVILAALILLS